MATQLNIVVVEDHDALREVTVNALSSKGHHVTGLESAEALYEHPNIQCIDLMLIDLNLPGESGLTLTHRIRQIHPNVGIIIVSANNLAEHKMQGYDQGADIYLTKPAALEELNSAINALTRRIKPQQSPSLSCLTLHSRTRQLVLHQTSISLNSQEASVVLALLRAPDQRLETWQLLEVAGRDHPDYSKASLEVLIVRLRKKLTQISPQPDLNPIQAIRNYGYQLCASITIAD
ncbi:response regulator transcription factor [Methylobacillus caricis]|uniref:response regulator transcription factor n=1 Tax=Methylobacillus caricis TaxID=1971611 RepID=UPI001CFF708B|nr:response regulator transcription factor [Methylobacillus caricis]MCB5188860.1 response regulator transcription factor [Methylobacillus caricis]